MTYCEAFTKNFHPCRGYAGGNGLCHAHQNWYKYNNWLHVLEVSVNPTTNYNWVKQILKNPKAVVCIYGTLEEYINDHYPLNPNPFQTIYELGCEAGRIIASNCPILWGKMVATNLNILNEFWMAQMHNERFNMHVYRLLKPYIYKENIIVFMELIAGMIKLNLPHEAQKRIITHMLPMIDPISLAFSPKDVVFNCFIAHFNSEIANKARWTLHANMHSLRDELTSILEFITAHCETHKSQTFASIKATFSPMKEDILKEVFHPRRIEKLITEHGIEILDEIYGC